MDPFVGPFISAILGYQPPFTVWFTALVVLLSAIFQYNKKLKNTDQINEELKGKVQITQEENKILRTENSGLKDRLSALQLAEGYHQSEQSATRIFHAFNKQYADARAAVVGVQIYEVITSLQGHERVYQYHVLSHESYIKNSQPLTSPADSVKVPDHLISELKRHANPRDIAAFIRKRIASIDRLCSIQFPSEDSVIANLVVLRVATTLQAEFAGLSIDPSFQNDEVVHQISSRRRTGIIEGIIMSEVVNKTSAYYFKKLDGTSEKKGRWYACIKIPNVNLVPLLTFSKSTQAKQVKELTQKYEDLLIQTIPL